ncbi:hypothetical protein PG995_007859 [Apiospora arundinis]
MDRIPQTLGSQAIRRGLRTRNSVTIVILVLLISTTLVLFTYLYPSSILRLEALDRSKNNETLSPIISSARPPINLRPLSSASPTIQPSTIPTPQTLSLPSEYSSIQGQDPYCEQRYTTRYLEMFRNGESTYCSPDSPSKITCFHTSPDFHEDGHRGSFCIGQGSNFDFTTNKFDMDCSMKPDIEVPLHELHAYWYETGPRFLFQNHFSIHTGDDELILWRRKNAARDTNKRKFTILIKREGSGNIFHCLHEIMSLTYTMDVLRMSRDPQTGQARFSAEDIPNTQIVIVDDLDDGPFFDLWHLVSDRPIKRLGELVKAEPEWLKTPKTTSFYP